MFNQFRLEISFKTIDELKNKIEFCIMNNIYYLNIPCKGKIKKEFLNDVIEFIGNNYEDLDVVYHYSCQHQFSRNVDKSNQELIDFIEFCIQYKNKELLLISGTNKKKGYQSLDVLNYLKRNSELKFDCGVAYNPYYNEYSEMKNERERFLNKLKCGIVKSVWLQFGSDINTLNKEIVFLKESLDKYSIINNNEILIYGSLFIPSRQFLARFNFRPWKSVFLSREYLCSIEHAIKITKRIVEIYSTNNILPLIETNCSTKKELDQIYNLLSI
mgnify:CR=1 FL=1